MGKQKQTTFYISFVARNGENINWKINIYTYSGTGAMKARTLPAQMGL